MEEAERCHQLAFLSDGRRVANGTPQQIRDMLDHAPVFTFSSSHQPKMMKALSGLGGVRVVNRFGNTVRLVGDASLTRARLADFLREWDGEDTDPQPAEANLEDVFIALTRNNQP
jgi:ABC-2 type transport system ATP-binding protein